ncbi:MAG: hypothetical protein KGM44_05425 [bacterium]|nr:hypothetical protein [bacterium]
MVVFAAIALLSFFPPVVLQADAAAPIGLQWDEVGQMLFGDQSVPAVGSFDQQVGELERDLGRGGSESSPAPKRRGGILGEIVNAVGQASVPGATAGPGEEPNLSRFGIGPAMFKTWTRTAILTQGHHWKRLDDLKSQTAVITKCDENQIIFLDLAKKTYRIATASGEPSEVAAPPHRAGPPQAAPPPMPSSEHPALPPALSGGKGPGTGTIAFGVTTKPLGAQSVNGQTAAGYETTMSYTMKGTGSCPNGAYEVRRVVYQTGFAMPRLWCPLPQRATTLPKQPAHAQAERPSCRPAFTAKSSGPKIDEQRFAMYERISMGAPSNQAAQTPPPTPTSLMGMMPGGHFSFIIQRGNLHWLADAQTDLAIFQIPAGFTQVK